MLPGPSMSRIYKLLKIRLMLGPGNMIRPRAVAGLAGHVHFFPCSCVGVGAGVVIALEFRRVAIGTHPVPVLVQPSPMQWILVGNVVIGIKVIPAPSALRFGPRIPRNR